VLGCGYARVGHYSRITPDVKGCTRTLKAAILDFRLEQGFSSPGPRLPRVLIRLRLGLALLPTGLAAGQTAHPAGAVLTPPAHLTAEQDHQKMMNLLHAVSLRPEQIPITRKRRMPSTMTNPRPIPTPSCRTPCCSTTAGKSPASPHGGTSAAPKSWRVSTGRSTVVSPKTRRR